MKWIKINKQKPNPPEDGSSHLIYLTLEAQAKGWPKVVLATFREVSESAKLQTRYIGRWDVLGQFARLEWSEVEARSDITMPSWSAPRPGEADITKKGLAKLRL
jgi:hypothetical protein